ncbi:hypothetical protein AB0M20_29660 [Actinoplanes sp. NPDC051633]|uniref:hypothetical protein n=1 Tax=Actinoplanes sp. NPDC051633 TaxID=3155670 RepID=UPI0034441A68
MWTILVRTERFLAVDGFDILPTLRAGLDLFEFVTGRRELTPREVGGCLALAAVFDLGVLWGALVPRLAGDAKVARQAFLECLTHEHHLAEVVLSPEELEARLSDALERTHYGLLDRRRSWFDHH